MAFYQHRCPSVKAILGTKTGNQPAYLIPIRCKRWTCKYCARINLKILLERIRRGRPSKFITLTAKPYYCETPAGTYHRHRPYIRRLVEYLREYFGEFEYVCITEFHKSGNPHWHMVVRSGFIPQTTISRKWEDYTGSRIVDIRKIHNARHAACYVAKYVMKSAGVARPDWLKRVTQFSKHYAPRRVWVKPVGYEWDRLQCSLSEALDKIEARGFILTESSFGFVIGPALDAVGSWLKELFDTKQSGHPP